MCVCVCVCVIILFGVWHEVPTRVNPSTHCEQSFEVYSGRHAHTPGDAHVSFPPKSEHEHASVGHGNSVVLTGQRQPKADVW